MRPGWWTRALAAPLAGALVALAVPASASAAGWTPVTGALGSSIHQIAQARAADGTLQVAWTRDTPGAGTSDVLHATISPAGVVTTETTIAAGFATASNPGIVIGSNGALTVFFGGIECVTTGCPEGLFATVSTDGGATWSAPASLLNVDQAYGSDLNAAILPNGTALQTWWHTTGTTVHLGTSSTTPDYDFQAGLGAGCCGYNSSLAVDASGTVQLAWYSNATAYQGVWTRGVDAATGAPSGGPLLMPGSVTTYAGAPNSAPILGRTPIVAVPSGGFDVAYSGGYPTTSKVLLWHIGATTSATIVDQAADHDAVSLAVDSQSRVWVFWTYSQSVFAERVDPDGTAEPPIDLGAPAGTSSIYDLDGSVDAAGDPQVLALAGLGNGTDETDFIRGPQTAPVTPPVLGQTFDAAVLSGTVLIKLPGHARDSLAKGSGFAPLTVARALPTGTQVDARAGTIKLVTATAKHGKTQSANFGGGLFKIGQSAKGVSKGLTTASILENAFAGAPGYSQCSHGAADPVGLDPHVGPLAGSAGASPRSKVLQTLHAHDNGGRFQTRTKASAGTVRGTTWTTTDTCGGTITKVQRGVVNVFAFRTRKTVRVTAGHSYYAKLP